MGAAIVLAALSAAVRAAASGGNASVTLNNGVEMPLLSYGANVYPPDTCRRATAWALEAGFRFVWSSEIVGEACQRAQRQAIDASGLPRSEVFLAGTVNTQECGGLEDCYRQTRAGAEEQLRILSSSKLDMLMLDYPSNAGCEGIKGQWKAFGEAYAAGRARTIAVSNFGEQELQCVVGIPGSTPPSVNQLPYNIEHGRQSVVAENRRLGVAVQAYSPLGSGAVLQEPALAEVARAHRKSPAQAALRWLVQQGVGVNVASTSFRHLQEDAAIFDFRLTAQEMDRLGAQPPPAVAAVSEVEAPQRAAAPPGVAAGAAAVLPGAAAALPTTAVARLLLLPAAVGGVVAAAMRLRWTPSSAPPAAPLGSEACE